MAETRSATAAAVRPNPTTPIAARRRTISVAVALGAVLVGGIAFEAWRLRDHPRQMPAASSPVTPEASGKVVDRAGSRSDGAETDQDPSSNPTVAPAPVAAGSPTPQGAPIDAAAPPPNGPTAPEPQATSIAAPPASVPAPTDNGAAIGITERAALLVDAPSDPQKVKTYVGFVVWKSESRSTGQGQPLSEAVIADVEIPDAKLTLSMVMKRNTEPQLPASHTIELNFKDETGSSVGPVKQINVPEMRLDDAAPTGDPLLGLPVAITTNQFLVGLSRGEAEGTNTQMLETRNWFDVSLLLASGKVAKITFEKGAPGRRTIDDAFKSWQSGG